MTNHLYGFTGTHNEIPHTHPIWSSGMDLGIDSWIFVVHDNWITMWASKDQPNHGPFIKSAYKLNEMTMKNWLSYQNCWWIGGIKSKEVTTGMYVPTKQASSKTSLVNATLDDLETNR